MEVLWMKLQKRKDSKFVLFNERLRLLSSVQGEVGGTHVSDNLNNKLIDLNYLCTRVMVYFETLVEI